MAFSNQPSYSSYVQVLSLFFSNTDNYGILYYNIKST